MAVRVIFGIAISALAFFIGAYVAQVTLEPRTVTIYKTTTKTKIEYQLIERPVVTKEYIERIVEKPIERIVEKPIELRNFENPEELKQWLKDSHVITVQARIVDSKTGQLIKEPDCDDYALKLQQKALADGYVMSFEIIQPSEYNTLFKGKRLPSGSLHAINLVVIGNNDVYYIEPQTYEVVLAAHLD